MAIRFERPVSRAAFWARRSGFLAALLFIAAFCLYRFGLVSVPEFVRFALVCAGIAALGVVLAVVGLAQLWQNGALGGVAAFRGLVYAALPLVAVGIAGATYMSSPRIFDLSTDNADPPPFLKIESADQQWLPRMIAPSANAVAAGAYVDLVGRRFDGAPDRVAAAVRKAARSARISIIASEGEEPLEIERIAPPIPVLRGTVASETRPVVIPIPMARPQQHLLSAPPVMIGKPGDVLFQGQSRTLISGMPFDIVIRLREEDDNTLVDVRTVARYGDSDFGVGAGLIRAFLDALEAEMLGLG